MFLKNTEDCDTVALPVPFPFALGQLCCLNDHFKSTLRPRPKPIILALLGGKLS